MTSARKFTVARSVTFYEQALVNAMRTSIGMHVSDTSSFQLVGPGEVTYSEHSKGVSNLSPVEHNTESKSSLTDSLALSELKTSAMPGRSLETSWKSLYMTPLARQPNSLRGEPKESA